MPPFPKLETWLMHTHVNDNNLMAHNIKEIHTLCFGDCTFKHSFFTKMWPGGLVHREWSHNIFFGFHNPLVIMVKSYVRLVPIRSFILCTIHIHIIGDHISI